MDKLTELKGKFKEYSFAIKPFICISIIFAIAISSIIRADFNYIDDLRRVAQGYIGWAGFSRFLSEFFAKIIHTSTYLTDISPLPQLIAVLVMALSAIIILYVYKKQKNFSVWDIIAIIPLGLSPYFLECFSYKYDAPYMAISVLASVFPLLFRKKKMLIYSITIILSTLVMCMTYQASSGIFLMIVLLLCLKSWNDGEEIKEIFKFLIISVINYLVGLLIFKTFIMIPTDTYVSNSIFALNQMIPGVLQNLRKYISIVLIDFKKEWLIIIAIMAISFIYVLVRDSKQKKYIAFIVTVIVLLAMLVLSFGMYLVLEEPLFAPRGMYGFGVFIALMGIVISTSKKVYPAKIVVLSLSWIFVVFSFTYGNALKVQDEYTDFRVNLVIQDLNNLEMFANNEAKYVEILGTIGQAPVLKNMEQDYQILNKLVPIQFRENWTWGTYYFYNYFDLRYVKKIQGLDPTRLPILKDTMYHTIKGNHSRILIELK